MEARSDRALARADRMATIAFWVGLTGVASYLAFAILTDQRGSSFHIVCKESWQESVLEVLQITPMLASPLAFVLGSAALWRPTRLRIRAGIALVAAVFCATGIFTLGIVSASC